MTTFMKNGIEVEMPEDDEKSRQNMIIAAEFMARMIRKYGDKVLAKIEAKSPCRSQEPRWLPDIQPGRRIMTGM